MAKRFVGTPLVIGKILFERIRKKLGMQRVDEKGLRAVMLRSALLVEAHAKMNITRKLNKDSTGLLKSRVGHRFEDKRSLIVGVLNAPVYARIHEFGGVITPKKAGSLSIPLSNRYKGSSPREFPNIFKGKGTNILFEKMGDGSVQAAYVLKKRVTIPARPYLGPAMGVARKRIIDLNIEYLRNKLGSN